MSASAGMNRWRELEDDASRATIILQKLTSKKEELKESLPRGTEPMPRSELHFCSGLAFTFVRKMGAGISFEAGHGFVLRKLVDAEGAQGGRPTWTWSAPLFMTVTAAGLGLTLGYTEIESIIVLDTPEAVQSFTKTQWAVDTDITGAAGGAVGAHLPATAANVSNMRLSDKTFTYSITKGAILDVSLTGLNYATDAAMNQTFYGNKVTPQQILDGAVEPPEPMRELYAALDKVMGEYYDTVEAAVGVDLQVERAGGGEGGAGTSAAGAAAGAGEAVAPAAADDSEIMPDAGGNGGAAAAAVAAAEAAAEAAAKGSEAGSEAP